MAVPDTVMTNADISAIVDTSDEWIIARTGIRERRIALGANLPRHRIKGCTGRA